MVSLKQTELTFLGECPWAADHTRVLDNKTEFDIGSTFILLVILTKQLKLFNDDMLRGQKGLPCSYHAVYQKKYNNCIHIYLSIPIELHINAYLCKYLYLSKYTSIFKYLSICLDIDVQRDRYRQISLIKLSAFGWCSIIQKQKKLPLVSKYLNYSDIPRTVILLNVKLLINYGHN